MIVPIAGGEVFVKTVVGAFVKLCAPGIRKLELNKTALKNQSFWDYRLEKLIKIKHRVSCTQTCLYIRVGYGAIVGLVVKSAGPMVDLFRLVVDKAFQFVRVAGGEGAGNDGFWNFPKCVGAILQIFKKMVK